MRLACVHADVIVTRIRTEFHGQGLARILYSCGLEEGRSLISSHRLTYVPDAPAISELQLIPSAAFTVILGFSAFLRPDHTPDGSFDR